MGGWTQESDGSFGDDETAVEFVGGDQINVRCDQGSGYETQHTSTSFPISMMAEMLRAAGYNVTPQATEFCVACKRHQADVDGAARFPQYVSMYVANLAEHRREVHGEVA